MANGTLAIVVTSPAGAVNTTTLSYSATDAQRLFQAWKNVAGPRDQNASPIGTIAQFAAWCAQLVQNQLASYVTMNEQTVPASPSINVANS